MEKINQNLKSEDLLAFFVVPFAIYYSLIQNEFVSLLIVIISSLYWFKRNAYSTISLLLLSLYPFLSNFEFALVIIASDCLSQIDEKKQCNGSWSIIGHLTNMPILFLLSVPSIEFLHQELIALYILLKFLNFPLNVVKKEKGSSYYFIGIITLAIIFLKTQFVLSPVICAFISIIALFNAIEKDSEKLFDLFLIITTALSKEIFLLGLCLSLLNKINDYFKILALIFIVIMVSSNYSSFFISPIYIYIILFLYSFSLDVTSFRKIKKINYKPILFYLILLGYPMYQIFLVVENKEINFTNKNLYISILCALAGTLSSYLLIHKFKFKVKPGAYSLFEILPNSPRLDFNMKNSNQIQMGSKRLTSLNHDFETSLWITLISLMLLIRLHL